MRKIPNLFLRDFDGDRSLVLPAFEPRSTWVYSEFNLGNVTASRKRDGTCVLIASEGCYKRRTIRPGQEMPEDFVPVGIDNGKIQGWVPVTVGDVHHFRIMGDAYEEGLRGTFELCGPKIQGNPEGLDRLMLFKHGEEVIETPPLDYDSCVAYFADVNIEGIVYKHTDGRMAKAKACDFGYPWGR